MTSRPTPGELPALADTHCHLDFQAFDEDRDEVLKRARQAGLVQLLNPGIDLGTSRAAVRLANMYAEVYAAVGVHPNDALTWDAGTLPTLRELASTGEAVARSKVVAIGEIGLDYYRDWAPRDRQRQVLLDQLELAAELELPVVIHNRQAAPDLLPILADWQAGLAAAGSPLAGRPGVLHSFSDAWEVAQEAIRLNFYIGINGPVTFRNAAGLQQVVARLPAAHLLIETDAPFLSPHPHRGQRNEPGRVRLIAEKIAELHQVPLSVMVEATSINAERLFHW